MRTNLKKLSGSLAGQTCVVLAVLVPFFSFVFPEVFREGLWLTLIFMMGLVAFISTAACAGYFLITGASLKQLPKDQPEKPLFREALGDLRSAIVDLIDTLQRAKDRKLARIDIPLGEGGGSALKQQLLNQIQRLNTINTTGRALFNNEEEAKLPALREKADPSILPSSLSQLLRVQQLLNSCLFSCKNDYHLLCHLKEELLAYKGLFTDLRTSINEELSFLRDAIKTQQHLIQQQVQGDRHLTLCSQLAGEIQAKLSACSEQSKEASLCIGAAIATIDSNLFSDGFVNIQTSNLEQHLTFEKSPHLGTLAHEEESEAQSSKAAADTFNLSSVLGEKNQLLASRLQLLHQERANYTKEASKITHAIAYAEAHHSLYGKKIQHLEDSLTGYSQRLQRLGDTLRQRVSELSTVCESLAKCEFSSREMHATYQHCLNLNEQYRRNLHEFQVTTTYCEQSLRQLVG